MALWIIQNSSQWLTAVKNKGLKEEDHHTSIHNTDEERKDLYPIAPLPLRIIDFCFI
jgi:hypothetical protein